MDYVTFLLVSFFAAVVFYRLWPRWRMTPKARVTAMLRRYNALLRSGLTEQECLLRLLETRPRWKNLPQRFLLALISRLRSKEDVVRFVSVSEEYRYLYNNYPAIARNVDLDAAAAEVACLFGKFGLRLQTEGRLKEAEFVQKLALRLAPRRYFTALPLAVTYHETGRHAQAAELFELGLADLETWSEQNAQTGGALAPAKCLDGDAEIGELEKGYRKMYERCRRALKTNALSGFCFAIVSELFC
jgi:hypothetical protein